MVGLKKPLNAKIYETSSFDPVPTFTLMKPVIMYCQEYSSYSKLFAQVWRIVIDDIVHISLMKHCNISPHLHKVAKCLLAIGLD